MAPAWDEAKRLANILKHGADFASVALFEWESAIVKEDRRRKYGETRQIAKGFIAGRLYILVYIVRDEDIRVISLRRANRREVRDYESGI
jgi:uncharacterized protein